MRQGRYQPLRIPSQWVRHSRTRVWLRASVAKYRRCRCKVWWLRPYAHVSDSNASRWGQSIASARQSRHRAHGGYVRWLRASNFQHGQLSRKRRPQLGRTNLWGQHLQPSWTGRRDSLRRWCLGHAAGAERPCRKCTHEHRQTGAREVGNRLNPAEAISQHRTSGVLARPFWSILMRPEWVGSFHSSICIPKARTCPATARHSGGDPASCTIQTTASPRA